MPALALVLAGLIPVVLLLRTSGPGAGSRPSCRVGTRAVSLLRLDHLTKRFDRHGVAVDDLSLSVEPARSSRCSGPPGAARPRPSA